MPEPGTYLLTNTGFGPSELPVISFQKEGTFLDFPPLGETLSLAFMTSERFCVGWRDITAGERYPCPDSQTLGGKYEQCQACQERTGFNPAFYNASSVSKQQEARNQEPHLLYLARFGKDVVKVGISHAKRGKSRLLEQGARDALILDTFPTAHIARQYEAKIAALPNIAETLQLRKKLTLLTQDYSHSDGTKELIETKRRIEDILSTEFTGREPLALDTFYFPGVSPKLSSSHDCTEQETISGKVVGMLGSLLFCTYKDSTVFLPLKKYVGYKVVLGHQETDLTLPVQQMSLF